MDPEPRQLMLTAGPAATVRQQLGLSADDDLAALRIPRAGLPAAVALRLNAWAAMFVELCESGGPSADAANGWAREGLEIAAALGADLDEQVQLRYVADSVPSTAQDWQDVSEPTAGLFEDVHALPVIPQSIGSTAYRSTLTLVFGRGSHQPAISAAPWLTAGRTDTTDDELRELRRRAIDPVVQSLLTADELATARVILYREDDGPGISVWLQAAGEDMQHWIQHPLDGVQWPLDPVHVAERFADSMQDWVCETRFAWGQRRIARYVVPPR